MTQKLTCPLIKKKNAERRATIHTDGNHTIYSVPSPMQLFIKCDDTDSSHKYVDDTARIEGMGDITFRAGCTVTAPDGTKWRTPMIHPLEEIKKDSKLFNLLRIFALPSNTTFSFVKDEDLRPLNEPTLAPDYTDPATWEEVADKAFDPQQYFPFLVRIASVIGLFLASGLALYWAYSRCRKRWGPSRFCPCIKPFPGDGPDQADIDDLQTQIRHLQQAMSSTFQSWKHSTMNFLDPQSRTKSCPDINDELAQAERPSAPQYIPEPPPLIKLKENSGSTYVYQGNCAKSILKRSPSVKFTVENEPVEYHQLS